jgi:hypothetical protein
MVGGVCRRRKEQAERARTRSFGGVGFGVSAHFRAACRTPSYARVYNRADPDVADGVSYAHARDEPRPVRGTHLDKIVTSVSSSTSDFACRAVAGAVLSRVAAASKAARLRWRRRRERMVRRERAGRAV